MSEISAKAYADAGVDLDAAARAKRRIANIASVATNERVVLGTGGFGGIFDADPNSTYLYVASTDSVGTKLRIAQAMGDHSTVGIDIVNHCVNDILPAGAEPLFFLDYIGLNGYDEELIAQVLRGVTAGCVENECALIGGETASLPGIYHGDDYDLVGFIVGRVRRDAKLKPNLVEPGDVLIAIPSSGLHTNGYSLVRSVFGIDDDPTALDELVPEDGRTLGEALLTPHRSYLNTLSPCLSQIKSLAHITGGSFAKNVPRAMNPRVGASIELSSWNPPPIFEMIQRRGEIEHSEMYNVFNMGVGMIAFLSPENVEPVLGSIDEAFVVGEAINSNGDGSQVTFV